MTSHAALSDHAVPWRVLMVTPSGYVEVVEVRAPNEAMALDTVRYWKPCHQVATDPPGNPLIWGPSRASRLAATRSGAGEEGMPPRACFTTAFGLSPAGEIVGSHTGPDPFRGVTKHRK